MSIKWVELSLPSPSGIDRRRSQAICETLNKTGLSTEVTFTETTEAELSEAIENAKTEFHQIRFSGEICEIVPKLLTSYPSNQLILKSADSLVREGEQWWPRNYLTEAIQRSFVSDLADLDRTSGVFILGANHEARAAVSALSKLGFSKFSVSDPEDQKSQSFVSALASVFFSSSFQVVPRYMITQLPGAYSVAVNTLVQGRDQGALSEMVYFNFLKPSGIWLDFALSPINSELSAEAESAGAIVQSGLKVAARADLLWAEACFGQELKALSPADHSLDFKTHFETLSRLFTESESRT